MAEPEPAVRAVAFESRRVYQSQHHPGYTSWVSFFPGERGQWYLTCEEVSLPDPPLAQCTRQQWHEMALPNGYDKSQYRMEMVILESTDDLRTWKVISREPGRFHHSAGSFGQARTRDGRFLRFVWGCYSLDPGLRPNEVLFESSDEGKTWVKMAPLHDAHFCIYAHRLRTLRDGTMVICAPFGPRWGKGTEYPTRAALNLNAVNQMQMMVFFSFDQGRTWQGPLPIYGGQNVSETDFVELPSGDLLFINSAIFPNPGRQLVYRDGNRFTPGPLERVRSGAAPETVCLTDDGIVVGCLRAGAYFWSDDWGQTWQPLVGIPDRQPEVYQPWINYLRDGRIACAGHYGHDDPIRNRDYDQYVSLHLFRVQVMRRTKDTRIEVERDFDEAANRWKNAYTVALTCDGQPLPGKELCLWYVERHQPGYDSFNTMPLEERMKMGGHRLDVRTGPDGVAHVALPGLDGITNVHQSYQLVVSFNANRADPTYKPARSPQLEFYANSQQDPPIDPEVERRGRRGKARRPEEARGS
jgi:hypothetical protein